MITVHILDIEHPTNDTVAEGHIVKLMNSPIMRGCWHPKQGRPQLISPIHTVILFSLPISCESEGHHF